MRLLHTSDWHVGKVLKGQNRLDEQIKALGQIVEVARDEKPDLVIVAGDLYDGCLIVDFESLALRVIDLDSYRRGPSTNDMGRMFGSLVGSSEENVRRAIAIAESVAPAILWVDEIDKAFAGSQSSGGTDGGTAARVFGTFLTWLSEKNAPVFVVATANEISQLPPELLRKGRFDEIFFVDLPSPAERSEVLRIHLARRGREAGAFDLSALVEASHDFSGAEIEEAVISALYDAFSSRQELETHHVLSALQETVPLARTMDEQINRLRQWADGRARNASVPRIVREPSRERRVEL